MDPERRGIPSKELERIERKSKLFMVAVILLVAIGVALGIWLRR
ncbi:MAG TPA: hypothetical protein VLV17_04335 [Anaeromyxobacteraceae bacterium]|nr:hypothetical protein [Anaeromyxobacteraceae bacterium]